MPDETDFTTVRISKEMYDYLIKFGVYGDSFDTCLRKGLEAVKDDKKGKR